MGMRLSTLWDWKVSGHSEVIRAARDVMQSYRDTGMVSADLLQAQKESRTSLLATSRAISTVRMAYRVQNIELIETMRLIRGVASVGRTGVYLWQAYSIAQIRVAEAQDRYRDASEKVAKLEEMRTQYMRDFGEQSVYTLDITEQLSRAKEREADTLKEVRRTQQQNILGYASMALAAANIIPTLVNVAQRLRLIGDLSGVVGGAAAAAEAAVTAKTAAAAGTTSMLGALAPLAGGAAFVGGLGLTAYMLSTVEERRAARIEAYQQQSMAAQVMQSFAGMGPPEFTINMYGDIVRIEDFEEAGEAVYDGFMRKVGEALR